MISQLHLKQCVIPILVLTGAYVKKQESTRTLIAFVPTLGLKEDFVMVSFQNAFRNERILEKITVFIVVQLNIL